MNQDIINEFLNVAYADPKHALWCIKNELMCYGGDWKSIYMGALTYMESDADAREEFIVAHIFPAMKLAGWPMPHSKAFNDVLWTVAHKEFTKG